MRLIDKQDWTECDFCQRTVRSPYGAIAQGATGRWCVVMSCCDDCANGQEIVPIEQARREADANGFADF